MIAVLGLVVGVVAGLLVRPEVPAVVEPYLPIAVVAALIVFLGDKLGVGAQLSTGVVVVLGIRIFSNAAAIRRHVFRA